MARRADWVISWSRPTSILDALRQVYLNLSSCCVFILLCIGTFFYDHVIQNFRKCLHAPETRFLTHQRPKILRPKKDASIPLNTMRPRSLTLPLSMEESDTKQRTDDQSQSELLSKLPYEVRSLIFEYAVTGDGNVVHVFKRGKRLGHWHCRRQVDGQPCSWVDPCSKALPFKAMTLDEHGVFSGGDPTMQRYFDKSKIEPSKKDLPALSLLSTCRQT